MLRCSLKKYKEGCMKKNVIITGKPRSGKSTLLASIIADITNKSGFVTKEIRENGERVGFEIETCSGRKSVFAHIKGETAYKVSRYFVRPEALDALLPEISIIRPGDILYLDEIGQMELFSQRFKEVVVSFLDAPNITIVTLTCAYEDDFIKSIRERDDVIILELTEENREEKKKSLLKILSDKGV